MSESCDEEFDESLEQVRGRARHARLDPQSRGAVCDAGDNKTTTNPLSLDGRGIKGEGETK